MQKRKKPSVIRFVLPQVAPTMSSLLVWFRSLTIACGCQEEHSSYLSGKASTSTHLETCTPLPEGCCPRDHGVPHGSSAGSAEAAPAARAQALRTDADSAAGTAEGIAAPHHRQAQTSSSQSAAQSPSAFVKPPPLPLLDLPPSGRRAPLTAPVDPSTSQSPAPSPTPSPSSSVGSHSPRPWALSKAALDRLALDGDSASHARRVSLVSAGSASATESAHSSSSAREKPLCRFGRDCRLDKCTNRHPQGRAMHEPFKMTPKIVLAPNCACETELTVRNLPNTVSAADLRREFEAYGPISGVRLPDPFRGNAHLQYPARADAERALMQFHVARHTPA